MNKFKLLFVTVVLFTMFAINYPTFANQNSILDKAEEFKIRVAANIPEFESWSDSKLFLNNLLYYPESNIVSGVLYDVLNKDSEIIGYLISNPENGMIMEFSGINSPYGSYLSEYIEKKFDNSKLKNVRLLYSLSEYSIEVELEGSKTKKIFNFTNDISVPIKVKNWKLDLQSETSSYTMSSIGYKLLTSDYDLDYYRSCIPTAIGNVIAYWDSHGYQNLIKGTMNEMIDEVDGLLIAYSGNNTSNSAIPVAVDWYCHVSTRYPSYFTTYNLLNPTYDQYKSEIDSLRPCLVGFGSNGPYGGAHMTAGFGYYFEPNIPSEKYVIVRDAWTTTPVNCYKLWSSAYNDFISRIIP